MDIAIITIIAIVVATTIGIIIAVIVATTIAIINTININITVDSSTIVRKIVM